jgi:predicted ATP-grasp superfamily ATP-dependent carboligase
VFGVQFLICGGEAYVIDFNPRIYGSLALAIAAGSNLPAIWADLVLGRPVSAPPYRIGVHYRAEEDDYRALAHAFRSGRRRDAVRGLLPRPRTVHAVFAARDPAPSIVTARKLFGHLRRR